MKNWTIAIVATIMIWFFAYSFFYAIEHYSKSMETGVTVLIVIFSLLIMKSIVSNR